MKSVFYAGAGIQSVLFFLNDGCLAPTLCMTSTLLFRDKLSFGGTERMQTYTTQMDAARKGIVTPQMEIVAKKRSIAPPRRSASGWPRARSPSRPTSTTSV